MFRGSDELGPVRRKIRKSGSKLSAVHNIQHFFVENMDSLDGRACKHACSCAPAMLVHVMVSLPPRNFSARPAGHFLGRRVNDFSRGASFGTIVLHVEGDELSESRRTDLDTVGGTRSSSVSRPGNSRNGAPHGPVLLTLRDLDSIASINTSVAVSERLAALGSHHRRRGAREDSAEL